MAKSSKRKDEQAKKQRRKSAAYKAGGGKSRYAMKHRGGGNTGPHGMWIRVQ
jgi:hypothetical protein